MEQEILSALQWHLNGPTVLCFIEHFADLIPHIIPHHSSSNDETWMTLMNIAKLYAELTLPDVRYIPMKPSTIAIACLSIAMKRIPADLINETDRRTFFVSIS